MAHQLCPFDTPPGRQEYYGEAYDIVSLLQLCREEKHIQLSCMHMYMYILYMYMAYVTMNNLKG